MPLQATAPVIGDDAAPVVRAVRRACVGSSARGRGTATWLCLLLFWGGPISAAAHTFAMPYTLPVPFSLYAYGATAALLLSFVIVGLLARREPAVEGVTEQASPGTPAPSARLMSVIQVLRAISLALLVLTIFTGLVGTNNPFTNFNMTFFWIIFVLGFAYLSAVCGDLYRWLNPWQTLCVLLERRWPRVFSGRWNYPPSFGYYPALALYGGFIWLELFGHTTPFGLAVALSAYTLINLAGAWVVGRAAWFRYGEFFGVFLGVIARMAPLDLSARRTPEGAQRILLRWRLPFAGLLDGQADHISLVVFILFMLSSTAFDGLHDSAPWSTFFWGGVYPWIDPLVKATSAQPYVVAARLLGYWQWLALLASPILYFAVYLAFLALTKAVARSPLPVRDLALRFAYSLVPIAFVYHVTHYYTVLLSQGPEIVVQASDPLGIGWNLFGTASAASPAIFIGASTIWHTQVGLILAGHVISVYLAHMEALRIFENRYRAALSQIPMLLLMVALTTAGLWILSLPIAAGQISMPMPSTTR